MGPDSAALAWQENKFNSSLGYEGSTIDISPVGDLSGGCGPLNRQLLVNNATEPYWGPAPVDLPPLFTALPAPVRLLDSRNSPTIDGQFTNLGARPAGSTTELTVGGRAGIAPTASAVTLNVAAVGPTTAGYVTVFPCGQPRPFASNLNFATGDVISNAVVASVGAAGKVCIYTSAATDIVVDASGTLQP